MNLQIGKIPDFFLVAFFLLNSLLFAQEKEIQIGIISNPNIKDSWSLEKNNFGIKPTDLDLEIKWQSEKSKLKYNINLLLQDESSYFKESFIKYNFSDSTFLRLGRYYRDFSIYLNDELSSGHILISNNAQPMQKIGFVTSKKINYFKSINFDFGLSHGIFDKNNFYNKSPLLHEKFLYININKKNYQFSIGIVHEAIWGGSTVDDGNQPSSFTDFLRVFFSEDRKIEDYSSVPNNPNWHPNALGNHVGIWDISYKKKNNGRITKFYYQHIFEDTSGLRFRNEIDGLWGLELKDYIPKTNVLFEYLHTTNQNMNPPYIAEAYYNHGTYKEGWSYKNYTLGNPFINHLYVEPLNILHFAANGSISDYLYEIKLSRKTNINDFIKYKINISKEIDNSIIIGFSVINSDQEVGLAASFSWTL